MYLTVMVWTFTDCHTRLCCVMVGLSRCAEPDAALGGPLKAADSVRAVEVARRQKRVSSAAKIKVSEKVE